MNSDRRKGTWLPLWIALGIAIGIFIGSKYGEIGKSVKGDGFGKMGAVLNYVRESYVDLSLIHI